jgi:phospholipid transport system substrate-binding protein
MKSRARSFGCAIAAALIALGSAATGANAAAPDSPAPSAGGAAATPSAPPAAVSPQAPGPRSPAAAAESPAESPTAVVEALHAALLDAMKHADALGYDGRARLLGPVIAQRFDVLFMARKAVGRYWKDASDEERSRYLETFQRFMVANYAGQFDAYSGQSFETLGEEPARMETVLVRTRLLDPTDKPVELNYRMRQVGGAWKIVDVYMDGTVSELARRRSEFSSIVKRESFDALIAALDQKIEKLSKES